MLNNVYFIGFRSEITRPDLLNPIKAPVTYKDPEAIARYVEKANERRERYNSRVPMIGSATEIYIVDFGGSNTIHFVKEGYTDSHSSVASVFCKWLSKVAVSRRGPTTRIGISVQETNPVDVVFCGYDIHSFMRMVAMEAMIADVTTDIYPQLWLDELGLLDPIDAVTKCSRYFAHSSDVSLTGALQFFFGKEIDDRAFLSEPITQAHIIRELTLRTRLLGDLRVHTETRLELPDTVDF